MKRRDYSKWGQRIGCWLSALALVCSLATSCDKDVTEAETSLPNGKYSLQLIAEQMQSQTHSAGKDSWIHGDKIAVRFGSMTHVNTYVMDSLGKVSPASSADAIYWQNTAESQITAWYPSEDDDFFIDDQSKGYAEFDFLRATAKGRYNQPVNLSFKHLMAKIEVTLIAGKGITKEEITAANVTIFGARIARFYDGEVDEYDGSSFQITPYYNATSQRYEAVVVPRNMKDKLLIRVSLGGKYFFYTPTAESVGNLEAGKLYHYAITVKADGIEVQATEGGSRSNGGEENVTVLVSKPYSKAQIGDFLLRDGSLVDKDSLKSFQKDSVAAVVFWTPAYTDTTGRVTPARLTDDKIMAADFPNCTHGLAVAVRDIAYESYPEFIFYWQEIPERVVNFQSDNFNLFPMSDYKSVASSTDSTDNVNYILGYQNTRVIQAYNAYCKANSKTKNIVIPVDLLSDFTASFPAPANSTGWFLPSMKELFMLFYKDVDDIFTPYENGWIPETKNIVNTSILFAGGKDLRDPYLSSSERWGGEVFGVYLNYGVGYVRKDGSGYRKRAVCAF